MATLELQPSYIRSAGIIWPIACTSVVAARFFIRSARKNRYGWDDWMVIPAWIMACGLSAIMLVGVVEKVMGYPTPPIPQSQFLTTNNPNLDLVRKLYWIAFLVSIPALTCIKLRCVAFYRRIFRTGHSNATDFVLYSIVAIILLWGVAFTITTIFSCGDPKNLDNFWTALENQFKCPVNPSIWQKGLTISDVIIDLILLVYPLPDIWKLHQSTALKIGTSIVFLFGSLSIAASTVRLVILFESLELEFQSRIDENYLTAEGVYFILLEVGFGLIAVCLPTLAGAMWLHTVRSVQNFFANMSDILSLRKQTSGASSTYRNDGSDSNTHRDKKLRSLSSKADSTDTRNNFTRVRPGSHAPEEQDGVYVSKTVELTDA